MAEFLVIRLGSERDDLASWIAVDDNGSRVSAAIAGPLADATRDIGNRSVIVLVPATTVLTTTVDIPIRGGSRLLAALPFALEEKLAEDIDKLHFAMGERRETGLLPAAVVSHEQMREWLDRLDDASITAAQIIPEIFGLSRIPGTLSLLVAEQQILFNDGADKEFVMQGVKPSDVLAVAGVLDGSSTDDTSDAQSQSGRGHLLVYCEPTDEERFKHDWIALRHELASVDINLLPDGVLPRLAVTVAAGSGINLLQGPYGAKSDFAALFRPWRYAAILLLALGISAFAAKAVDYYRLGQEEAALQQQFTEMYALVRPGDGQVSSDPMAAVNSLRRSLGGPAAVQIFLPSLQQLGSALQQNNLARVEAISYRAGVIDVRLTAPDVATLDRIQKGVSRSGRFSASIQSTDQVGDKVSSRIQIKEIGA